MGKTAEEIKWEKRPFDEKVRILNENIEERKAHWEYLKENGCSDPFWSDGVNMNLVRNHIIYYITQLLDLKREPRQTSLFDVQIEVAENPEFDSRVPPLMPNDYMANDRKLLI